MANSQNLNIRESLSIVNGRKQLSRCIVDHQNQLIAEALVKLGYSDIAIKVKEAKRDYEDDMSWKKFVSLTSLPILTRLEKISRKFSYSHNNPLDLVMVLALLDENPVLIEKMSKLKGKVHISNALDILVHRTICQKLLQDEECWLWHINTKVPLSLRLLSLENLGVRDAVNYFRDSKCKNDCRKKSIKEFHTHMKEKRIKDPASEYLPKGHDLQKLHYEDYKEVFEAIDKNVQYDGCSTETKLELTAYTILQNMELTEDDLGFEAPSSKKLNCCDLVEEKYKTLDEIHDQLHEQNITSYDVKLQKANSSTSMPWYQMPHLGDDIYRRKSARLLSTSNVDRSFSTSCPVNSWTETPAIVKKFRAYRDLVNFRGAVDPKFDDKEFLQGCKMVSLSIFFF